MEEGFKSTIPLGDDQLFLPRNMDSTSLASTFPFTSATLTQDKGVMYGINQLNGSLIIFDRYSLENGNEVVFGKSGADTLRVYEMFMGPFEQMIPWDEKGIVGARRFIERVYILGNKETFVKVGDENVNALLHKTIKKVSEDIEAMKFNTAISSLMVLANGFFDHIDSLTKDQMKAFLLILSPFMPHVTEELWERLGFAGLCSQHTWPKYDEALTKGGNITLIIQVNGKVRDKMEMRAGLDQSQVEGLVLNAPKVKPWLEGKEVRKVIFVPDKLINIVI
jgi:leucyl-tRNA synthetase